MCNAIILPIWRFAGRTNMTSSLQIALWMGNCKGAAMKMPVFAYDNAVHTLVACLLTASLLSGDTVSTIPSSIRSLIRKMAG
jgi:hypothetical protein